MELSFIVIDESELDCFIARKVIQHTDNKLKVITYLEATKALDDIANGRILSPDQFIILLDLQMPVMNGFQFVEEFEKLPAETRDKYLIFILSSTRNKSDILRIAAFKSVKRVLEKPLTKDSLLLLLSEVTTNNNLSHS